MIVLVFGERAPQPVLQLARKSRSVGTVPSGVQKSLPVRPRKSPARHDWCPESRSAERADSHPRSRTHPHSKGRRAHSRDAARRARGCRSPARLPRPPATSRFPPAASQRPASGHDCRVRARPGTRPARRQRLCDPLAADVETLIEHSHQPEDVCLGSSSPVCRRNAARMSRGECAPSRWTSTSTPRPILPSSAARDGRVVQGEIQLAVGLAEGHDLDRAQRRAAWDRYPYAHGLTSYAQRAREVQNKCTPGGVSGRANSKRRAEMPSSSRSKTRTRKPRSAARSTSTGISPPVASRTSRPSTR